MYCHYIGENEDRKFYVLFEETCLIGDFIFHTGTNKIDFIRLAKNLTQKNKEDLEYWKVKVLKDLVW